MGFIYSIPSLLYTLRNLTFTINQYGMFFTFIGLIILLVFISTLFKKQFYLFVKYITIYFSILGYSTVLNSDDNLTMECG